MKKKILIGLLIVFIFGTGIYICSTSSELGMTIETCRELDNDIRIWQGAHREDYPDILREMNNTFVANCRGKNISRTNIFAELNVIQPRRLPEELCKATELILAKRIRALERRGSGIREVAAIGVTYAQMHMLGCEENREKWKAAAIRNTVIASVRLAEIDRKYKSETIQILGGTYFLLGNRSAMQMFVAGINNDPYVTPLDKQWANNMLALMPEEK